jgi:hypothetical protein
MVNQLVSLRFQSLKLREPVTGRGWRRAAAFAAFKERAVRAWFFVGPRLLARAACSPG